MCVFVFYLYTWTMDLVFHFENCRYNTVVVGPTQKHLRKGSAMINFAYSIYLLGDEEQTLVEHLHHTHDIHLWLCCAAASTRWRCNMSEKTGYQYIFMRRFRITAASQAGRTTTTNTAAMRQKEIARRREYDGVTSPITTHTHNTVTNTNNSVVWIWCGRRDDDETNKEHEQPTRDDETEDRNAMRTRTTTR